MTKLQRLRNDLAILKSRFRKCKNPEEIPLYRALINTAERDLRAMMK